MKSNTYYGVALSPQFTPSYPGKTNRNIYGETRKANTLPQASRTGHTVDEIEMAWQRYYLEDTPNGNLIRNHTLFDGLQNNQGMTLLHLTSAYELIEQSGYLYPSGGSLGSSVYCVPMRADGKAHSLLNFILDYEIPESQKARSITGKKPVILAIKIDRESTAIMDMELSGMDHLLLGELQCDLYEEFAAQAEISAQTKQNIERRMADMVRRSHDFLNLCCAYDLKSVDSKTFFKDFQELLQTIPFFGYVYFEAITEYCAFFQNDPRSTQLNELGEINSANFKKMIFEVSSHLLSSFKLIEFRPDISEIAAYIKDKGDSFVAGFNAQQFVDFMKWRIAQIIRFKVMSCQSLGKGATFDELCADNTSLMGHVLRSEIAAAPELKEVSYLYDILRASKIRDFWTRKNILFPYNAIIPKGEVGVNPSFEGLSYKVCRATLDDDGTVVFGDETGIQLASQLVSPSLSNLRFQTKA